MRVHYQNTNTRYVVGIQSINFLDANIPEASYEVSNLKEADYYITADMDVITELLIKKGKVIILLEVNGDKITKVWEI